MQSFVLLVLRWQKTAATWSRPSKRATGLIELYLTATLGILVVGASRSAGRDRTVRGVTAGPTHVVDEPCGPAGRAELVRVADDDRRPPTDRSTRPVTTDDEIGDLARR
jgi:hypothetical protein